MILDETQEAIRDMTRQFAQEVLWPKAAERDKSCSFPRTELTQMGELVLMGMLVPD
jgi:butyryl-CoA dehydrogenase